MKFKDCGVRWNKIVFVRPQDLQKYSNNLIGLSTFLNGTITVVPNLQRDSHDYQVVWATNGSLPISSDHDHLHTMFNKSNKEDYQILILPKLHMTRNIQMLRVKYLSIFVLKCQELLAPMQLSWIHRTTQVALRHLWNMYSQQQR